MHTLPTDKLSTIVDIACTAPKIFDPPKSTIHDLYVYIVQLVIGSTNFKSKLET